MRWRIAVTILLPIYFSLLAGCSPSAPNVNPTQTTTAATVASSVNYTPTATETANPVPTAAVKPTEPKLLFIPTSGKTHFDLAELMVQNVQLANTSYQHKETLVTWAGLNGANDYVSYADCSGFINALLAQAYGLTPDDFKNWLGTRRPLAKEYFAAITSQRGFTAIANIAQVQPGDVIAIRYLNGAPGDNTGHILLVAAAPQTHTASKPLLSGAAQWDVTIIDSSESGHGKNDTRRLPDGAFHDGVGRGVMRLYTDSAGGIVAYAWSDLANSELYDKTARPLAIGRLDSQFALQ